jgi:drug/metabolite transporter (DMT)-like permease
MCLVSMLLFALYLALGRRNRDFPSVWLYVIPVYGQAAAVCLLVALPRISHVRASGRAASGRSCSASARSPRCAGIRS